MANLTITVDEDVLKRARIRALEEDTSVNSLLRQYLESYAGDDPARNALGEFLEIAGKAKSGSGPKGRTWTRDDLYDR